MLDRLTFLQPLGYATNQLSALLGILDHGLGGDILVNIAISTSFWTAMYVVLCLSNSCSKEWNCRLVTLVHAITSVILVGRSAFIVGPWTFDNIGGTSSPFEEAVMQISLGYFLFDVVWCLVYQADDYVMLIHHVASISGLVAGLYLGTSGTELVATIGGAEFSNPMLQSRWFLREVGLYDTAYGFVTDTIFTVSFAFVRFGVGTPLLYCTFREGRTHWFLMIGATALYILSIVWFVAIAKMYHKRYMRAKSSKTS